MPKALWLTLLWIAAAVVVLYGSLLALLWWKQESLMFFPVRLPADHRLANAPDVHERTVQVDGARLSVLHLKLPRPRGVVFFLHGNAGNLAGWFTGVDFYRQANFDLVMPDYRGFGKSTGRITGAQQLRQDVRAVWDSVAPQYQGQRVVLYGRSLGTGLAAQLAADLAAAGRAPDLVVLASPYSSMRELTAEFYPWVPPALLRYPLATVAHLQAVASPILLLQGERDTLIGVHHARRLQQARPDAQLIVVPGVGHNDLHEHPVYRRALAEALAAR